MSKARRYIIGGIIIVAALTYLITQGMRESMVYFKTPSELKKEERPSKDKFLRMGGMVVPGSLKKDTQNLTYRFELTDGIESVPVHFRGVPPDLFSEGKGAVVEGRLGADGVFTASAIMAKHAEDYSPPPEGQAAAPKSFVPAQEEKRP